MLCSEGESSDLRFWQFCRSCPDQLFELPPLLQFVSFVNVATPCA